ncbi:ACT domain-containing protein [Siminovitchia sp. 179-K 8D1 HS]|uniref:ACT domain-containing protein n=1 Tax=Siminovitchia sp. 179-K 8D1 HS TaxID=3142385 RepID=UPI0039A23225
MEKRRAVVSVIGKDQVGIIAGVTKILADHYINILDIRQTILQDFFTMMMVVDVTDIENLDGLQKQFDELGGAIGQQINIQREEIFQTMHRI